MIDGFKRMLRMVFRRGPWRVFQLGRSMFDWQGAVGDGTGSSTVTAPLFWVARTFPEAPPALWEVDSKGQEEQIRDHPMLRLMTKPNEGYEGPVLWAATVTDYLVDGNAYWLKLRDQGQRVAKLWWIPSWLIEPMGDDDNESVYVSYYKYTPGTEPLAIRPEDVVHFRQGLDPNDERRGCSPLKSVLREVYTDDEAASFTANLLRNMGVPGLVVSPDGDVVLNEEEAQEAKDFLLQKFTGDKKGEPLVMTSKTQVQQFGFSPEQLVLRELRRIPEERVTAVLGVPAIVAGLGAGLDRSTFTNMAEAREAAYESGIIPMQRNMAEQIRFQLLNEFESDPFMWRFGFDLSKVRVLQEDLYRQAQRHDLAIRGGWEMVSEGRRAMGYEVVDDRDNVFLRQGSVKAVTGEEEEEPPAPPPLPPGGNGNGDGDDDGDSPPDGARAIAREVIDEMRRVELTEGTRR